MAKQDLHLTTEQLSALIDEQRSLEEQTRYSAHLETCQQCQQSLEDLRLTVSLLRALPQPTLPRSFVLPADAGTSVKPIPLHAPRQPLHLPAHPRHRQWPPYVQGALRSMSTIAAVLGLVFLLSGLLTALPRNGAMTSATTMNAPAIAAPHQSPSITSTAGGATSQASKDGTPTPLPSPTSTFGTVRSPGSSDASAHDDPSSPGWLAALDVTTAGGRAVWGIILLALALLSFLLLRWQGKHTRTG